MCGFLGGININSERFQNAKDLIRHRGPDENGEFFYKNLYFYHVRLSIQDIKTGQQPMSINGYTIIFNGEIYNHKELRNQFNIEGKTNSDTETILLLYQKFGIIFLKYLDGMFSFAIYNERKNTLILARDRAGEKPLYYHLARNEFAFGSELNALSKIINPELEPSNFHQYLRYSFIGQNTPYKGVYEIPAGSWYEIDIHTLSATSKKWWEIETFYKEDSLLNLQESIEKTDHLLRKSIYNRLNSSDLEVGTFLSGGIDSGLVTSISSEFKSNLKTFTVSFEGLFDESALAQLVSDKYGTQHTKINISLEDLKYDIEKILSNYGEPFADSSAIPSYYVSREAKKYLTVVLNGDGADELFGGYRRYVPFAKFDFFKDHFIIKNISQLLFHIIPSPKQKLNKYNYIYRLIDFSRKDALNSYLSATVDTFEGYEKFLNNPPIDSFKDVKSMLNNFENLNFSGLKKIMCLDFNFLLATDLLVKMDIATMAHSLEARTPFFNNELLEFAPTIKDSFKIHGISTKYILRQLATKYLPAELINQPKRGFEVPLKNWMENELKEITMDYLSGDTFVENFVNKSFITNLLSSKIRVEPEKRAKMLWRLLAMEVWYKKCYNGSSTNL
jgi:asparagine synthase (glutamine-hydrolysing)